MTQLSTEVLTHRLKIKWEGTRYITRKLAEHIFQQLSDQNSKTVTISNPKTLTYFQKYKTEVELFELKVEERSFEDMLHNAGLKEHEKDYIRSVWEERKKERKSTSDAVLQEMLRVYKSKWDIY